MDFFKPKFIDKCKNDFIEIKTILTTTSVFPSEALDPSSYLEQRFEKKVQDRTSFINSNLTTKRQINLKARNKKKIQKIFDNKVSRNICNFS